MNVAVGVPIVGHLGFLIDLTVVGIARVTCMVGVASPSPMR